ncbi:SET domain-containing protein [Sarocladium implicatum]|nr:SET domain-containing protein [Sarocladium implicatum]
MSDTLVAWALEHGATLHPSVEVYDDVTTGLSFRIKPSAVGGLAAAGDNPGDAQRVPVVSVPATLSLSYLTALDSLPVGFTGAVKPHVVGRFFLIQQFLLGKESLWWPYIQALPQPSDHEAWELPPFWPEDDAELLDGTNVEVGIQKIRRDVQTEFKNAQQVLSRLDHALADVRLNMYQWAYSIFSSRSFRPSLVLSDATLPDGVAIDDFSVLLPLFDIGNHDMTAPTQWVRENQGCSLYVDRDYKAGEQVFNNYSMKTNAELLLGYGFMIPATNGLHNDYIHVRKRTDTMEASEEYFVSMRPMDDPSSVLGRTKQVSDVPNVLRSFRHVQQDMVWDIFCTVAASADPINNDVKPQDVLSGNFHGGLRPFLIQTVAIIQHKILQELERLDETDLEVDEDQRADLTRNQRLALDYRASCRQVLESTLEAIASDDAVDAA